jgi:homoserine kinase type II
MGGNKANFAYVAMHENPRSEDLKFIGVFSSRKLAREAINSLRSVKGFSNSKRGFYIEKYEINKIHWQDGFITVFSKEQAPETEPNI